jgi:serine/threonine protein kinase
LGIDTNDDTVGCVKVFKNSEQQTLKSYECEIKAGFMNLDHPNLGSLIGYGFSQMVENGEASGVDQLYLVMKYESNGDLFDLLNMSPNGLPVEIAKFFFAHLVAALEYLHRKNVAHRDLKLENCFLDENFNLKVGDFGLLTLIE